MSRVLAVHLETSPARSWAVERSFDLRPLVSRRLSSMAVLVAEREERAESFWYSVQNVASYGEVRQEEREALADFDRALAPASEEDVPPFWVGFRSNSFDFPLLRLRAMAHAAPLTCLGRQENRLYSPWARRSPSFHCDLAEEVLGRRSGGLDDALKAVGLPHRSAGLSVPDNATPIEGPVTMIWSELSALSIWMLFLRWGLAINELSRRTYKMSVDSVSEFVVRDGRAHLVLWLEAYDKSFPTGETAGEGSAPATPARAVSAVMPRKRARVSPRRNESGPMPASIGAGPVGERA